MPVTNSIKRLFDIPSVLQKRFGGQHLVFENRDNGRVEQTTVSEYLLKSARFSSFLISANIARGDRVITVLKNRAEWYFADIGILQVGGVHVPVSPLYSDDQLVHIFGLIR